MNIYKVSQDANNGYDTYDSFICYAENEIKAQYMLPSTDCKWDNRYSTWCYKPEQAKVEYLGTNKNINESSILCNSFNAG